VLDGNKEERVYRLNQTVVRRVREGDDAAHKPAHAGPEKSATR
jgi:hypothetical protein